MLHLHNHLQLRHIRTSAVTDAATHRHANSHLKQKVQSSCALLYIKSARFTETQLHFDRIWSEVCSVSGDWVQQNATELLCRKKQMHTWSQKQLWEHVVQDHKIKSDSKKEITHTKKIKTSNPAYRAYGFMVLWLYGFMVLATWGDEEHPNVTKHPYRLLQRG